MIPLADFFENAEISLIFDNAKTHQPKPEPEPVPRRRNGVKRTTSLPMDLSFGSDRRRRRRTRRGSDSTVPTSRWSAEPNSPLKKEKHGLMLPSSASSTASTANTTASNKLKSNMHAPPCVLRNVLKPVRQDSRENVNYTGHRGGRHSLMPMMPVRQNSLRELMGGSSPQKRSPKVDTVDLITQALEQLDSLSEDEDLMMRSPMSSSSSLPCMPTVPL